MNITRRSAFALFYAPALAAPAPSPKKPTTLSRMSQLVRALRRASGGEVFVLAPDFELDARLTRVAPPRPVIIDCSALTVSEKWACREVANLTFHGGRWLIRLRLDGGKNVTVRNAAAVGLDVNGGSELEVAHCDFTGVCALSDLDGVHVHDISVRSPDADAFVFADCCDLVAERIIVKGMQHLEGRHPDVMQFRAVKRRNERLTVRKLTAEGNSQGLVFQMQNGMKFADITLTDINLKLGMKHGLTLEDIEGVTTVGRVALGRWPESRHSPTMYARNCEKVVDLGGHSLNGRPFKFR